MTNTSRRAFLSALGSMAPLSNLLTVGDVNAQSPLSIGTILIRRALVHLRDGTYTLVKNPHFDFEVTFGKRPDSAYRVIHNHDRVTGDNYTKVFGDDMDNMVVDNQETNVPMQRRCEILSRKGEGVYSIHELIMYTSGGDSKGYSLLRDIDDTILRVVAARVLRQQGGEQPQFSNRGEFDFRIPGTDLFTPYQELDTRISDLFNGR